MPRTPHGLGGGSLVVPGVPRLVHVAIALILSAPPSPDVWASHDRFGDLVLGGTAAVVPSF